MSRDSSMVPQPSSGGGLAKYAVILLLLIGGGVGVWIATGGGEPKPDPAAAVPPPKAAERSTALAENTLEIPEPVPDAGAPTAADVPKKVRTRVVDAWDCSGDVPVDKIRSVLADSSTQIRSCYERRLRVQNVLQGSVNLQVRIGAGGEVSATRARGTLRDKEVANCMENIAKNWRFPAPAGGNCAVVDAPYNFTPKTN